MCVFWKKTKSNLSVGGSAPDSPFASGSWEFRPQPLWFYSHLLHVLQLCQVRF